MSRFLHSSIQPLSLFSLIFTVFTTLRQAHGDSSQRGAWINPQAEGEEVSSPPSYKIGSSLPLEWTTNFSTEYVLLYANDGNPNHYEVVLDNKSTSTFGSSYNWTVATTLQLIYGFNLVLYNDTLGATFLDHVATVPFNITPTSSPSPSTTTAGAASTTVAASTTGGASTTRDPNRAIGLGVGLGIGLPVVLGIVSLCLLVRLFMRRRLRPRLPGTPLEFYDQPISRLPGTPLEFYDQPISRLSGTPLELHVQPFSSLLRDRPPAELPGLDVAELSQERANGLHESFIAAPSPSRGF